MIAGTLAVYTDPPDEPLSDYRRGDGIPALEVTSTQETHGDSTPQRGTVAGRIEATDTLISVTGPPDDVDIETERVDDLTTIATDWTADVTGSGVILAESIAANEELPFPFDVFGGIANSRVQRQQIDVADLHSEWNSAGGLADVWMASDDSQVGTQMLYHGAATNANEPTIGLGFKRAWNGTTIKGVVYASGYVALYTARHAADGVQFVADEILPHAEPWDPAIQQDQTDFDEFGGGA